MERGVHFHPADWRIRNLKAYGISFALLAFVLDSFPFGLASPSTTPASAFLSFLKSSVLPKGWQIIGLTPTTSAELGILTSLAFASLTSHAMFC